MKIGKHDKKQDNIQPETCETMEQTGEALEGIEVPEDELARDIEIVQSEIERLKADAQESHNRYLRTLADFDNFRKRQREESSRLVGNAREDVIKKILPIVDNFERAICAAQSAHSFEALNEGVSLTLRQLTDILEREGVEPIEAVGQEFNPELHEAMLREITDEIPENTVVEEFEKGYILNGKVLRPSRVKVAASS